MRKGADRIRHALGFEVIGLLLCVPVASSATSANIVHVGLLGGGMSVLATVWNFAYNVSVDRFMLAFTGRLEKNVLERVVHAICFELGLLLLTLPVIAYTLSIGLLEALVIDLWFVVFYVFYAFFYNLAYDKLFPLQPSAC